jgi:LmbE family N-acetylglucosaminyl deacetylase
VTTVLSPHFDDAILSCWSVLSREPGTAAINVFTAAPAGDVPLTSWDRFTGARDPRERMLERAREDAEALERVGVRPVNLPFVINDYRRREQDVKPLVSQIRLHLNGSTIYAPAGIGRHPDHFAVRAAAVWLLAQGFAVILYGELPYCCHYGWPHWVHGGEPDPHLDVTFDWKQSLGYGDVSVAPEAAVITELSPREQEEKLSAIRMYRTQYSGMARLLAAEDALRYEVFWPLEPTNHGRLRSLSQQLLWNLGARRGSRLDRLFHHRVLRRLRPRSDSRVGRLLRSRGTR